MCFQKRKEFWEGKFLFIHNLGHQKLNIFTSNKVSWYPKHCLTETLAHKNYIIKKRDLRQNKFAATKKKNL